MAAVAPAADKTADLLQNLSLDSKTNNSQIPDPANKKIQSSECSVTPVLQNVMDPTVCYVPNGYPYYYGVYEGTGNGWEGFSPYPSQDGVDMTTGVYGDNRSLLYHNGYSYASYAPYSPAGSPVPTMGNDGQLYGPQHYHYPSYFPPPNPTSETYNPVAATQKAYNAKSNSNLKAGVREDNNVAPLKSYQQDTYFKSNDSQGRTHSSGVWSPIPWSGGQSRPVTTLASPNSVPSSGNQNFQTNLHYTNLHHPRPLSGAGSANGLMNRLYPNKFHDQYGNSLGSGVAYRSNGYGSWANGRGHFYVDNKYKPRGRGNGYYNYNDDLSELNRGPRAKDSKNQKGFGPITFAVKGQDISSNGSSDEDKAKTALTPDREQYNKADLPVEYENAKFFIIKSYSEDDVHKSIKYNVWASTPSGNKKLDAAYKEAQDRSGGPVFLFFSVNTSGQFVGLAEMDGPVDFNTTCQYWQQDKWNGCFSVKWHIVKDVSNSLLKHLTLENNENKPVTNSRDTQEVMLEQGLKMIKIFKDHPSKTCILDDFGFYEARQKTIQERKAKQQQLQKQLSDKAASYEMKKEANGDLKLSENGSTPITGETIDGAEPAI